MRQIYKNLKIYISLIRQAKKNERCDIKNIVKSDCFLQYTLCLSRQPLQALMTSQPKLKNEILVQGGLYLNPFF